MVFFLVRYEVRPRVETRSAIFAQELPATLCHDYIPANLLNNWSKTYGFSSAISAIDFPLTAEKS